jgi:hypothetical protein
MGIFTKSCPACGTRVMRGLGSTCSQCGDTVHGAWRTCPSCKDIQKSSSKHCTRCGDSFPTGSEPVALAPEVWRRTWVESKKDGTTVPRELARRFDLEEFNPEEGGKIVNRGVIVESGMRAHIVHDNAVVFSLESGHWTEQALKDKLASLREKAGGVFRHQDGLKDTRGVQGFWEGAAKVVLLVEAGDVVVDFDLGLGKKKLLTRDKQELRAELQLVMRFGDLQALYENVLKGQEDFTHAQLRKTLFPELRNAVSDFLGGKDAQELVSTGIDLKREMEEALRAHLAQTLGRMGVVLIQLRATDFQGDWIDVESELGRVVLEERKAKAWAKLQRLAANKTLGKARLDAEFTRALAEIEVENAKRGFLQDEVLRQLQQTIGDKNEDHEIRRRRLFETAELEHNVAQEEIRIQGLRLDGEKARHEVAAARVRWEAQLSEKRARSAERRETETADELARLETLEKSAEVKDRIKKLKIERGFAARERKDQLDLARKAREQELALGAEGTRARIKREDRAQELAFEGKMLESMENWSEDKMLAFLSQRSKESAQVLIEKAKAQAQAQGKGEEVLNATLGRVMSILERQAATPPVVFPGAAPPPPPQRLCAGCNAYSPAQHAACARCQTPFA